MDLPFRITVCGLAELAGHCDARVSHVLSILDPEWPVPEAFGSFGEHDKLELRFHDIIEPRPGEVLPTREHVRELLAFGRRLDEDATQDKHLLVHCHAGISRSSAAMTLLIAQARPDLAADDILKEILKIRPQIWPNLRIVEMGDEELGRHGELVRAVPSIYRWQIERKPHLVEDFRACGRGREIEAALAEAES